MISIGLNVRNLTCIFFAAVACPLIVSIATAQAPASGQNPQMSQDVFKNIQVLKGIPVNEFMNTMGFFSAAVGLNCTGCHVAESLENLDKFAEDVPRKRIARQMILMVQSMNKTSFGGRRALTCYTCHRGSPVPEVIPSLTEQYEVPPEDPDRVEIIPDVPSEPAASHILDNYIQALGGERPSRLSQAMSPGARRKATTPITCLCRLRSTQRRPISAPWSTTRRMATILRFSMDNPAG